jgi:hypothetical protein
MQKLTIRDLFSTLILAAVLIPFVGYSVRGTMPFVQDPRGMAGVGIVGAVLAIAVFGRRAFGSGAFAWLTLGSALVGVGFGVAALVAENTWWLLVPMIAGTVVAWALLLAHDAGFVGSRLAHHG